MVNQRVQKTGLAGILIFTIGCFFIVGCSGGSGNPVAPSEKPENNGKEQGLEQAGGSGDRHNLWGIWEISVDPVTEEVSIEPKREAVAHFNI